MIYGMGMLEMGMTMSYEQLLIDSEIVRMVRRSLQGITVDDVHIAAEVLKSVGPGGTFLSQKHTMKHMKKESSQAMLFDRRMYESWEKDGCKDIREIASEKAKEILENHKPDPLPLHVQKQIDDIIEEAEERLKNRASKG